MMTGRNVRLSPESTMENVMYYEGNNTATYISGSGNFPAGDIIQIALDLDNQKVFYGLNGTFQGNPATGSSPAFSGITAGENICFFARTLNAVFEWNFGNGYFGTTAITTNSGNGYSGAEGSSKFNQIVPTGYSAVSTKGLNE